MQMSKIKVLQSLYDHEISVEEAYENLNVLNRLSTIYKCKSLADDSPAGPIHLNGDSYENTLCGEEIEQNGLWFVTDMEATCKKCLGLFVKG